MMALTYIGCGTSIAVAVVVAVVVVDAFSLSYSSGLCSNKPLVFVKRVHDTFYTSKHASFCLTFSMHTANVLAVWSGRVGLDWIGLALRRMQRACMQSCHDKPDHIPYIHAHMYVRAFLVLFA